MESKKPTYTREQRDMTEENRKAVSLLKQEGELIKPYGSEVLGSISFHVCVRYNMLSGQGEIFVPKVMTEMNISEDVAKAFATVIRDESLAALGMKMTGMRPDTVDEKEEKKEIEALAKEQRIIQ